MSITDELREFMDGADGYELWCPRHKTELASIADRIDAEHQKAEDEWKAKDGQSWLHGYGECHAELMEGNEAIAADLEEAGWMQLPKDADGKAIHIGDKMTHDFGYGKTVTVLGFGVPNCHDADQGVFASNGEEYGWYSTSFLHHIERPTVEGTLRELVEHVTPGVEWENELFAKYADRIKEVLHDERVRDV